MNLIFRLAWSALLICKAIFMSEDPSDLHVIEHYGLEDGQRNIGSQGLFQ